MTRPRRLLAALLSISALLVNYQALAQSTDDDGTRSTSRTTDGRRTTNLPPFTYSGIVVATPSGVSAPTGSYLTYSSQITDATTALTSSSSSTGGRNNSSAQLTSNSSGSSGSSSTSNSLFLVGTNSLNATATLTSTTLNGTGTSTTASTPTNTQPCNGYLDFCNRKYSNITQVCAHNSAFDVKNNAASNQDISIPGQLNDGVRMIQGETHYVNNTLYSCHTSCNLLNAGPLVNQLTTVREWIEANPYDVVTILLVNSDYVTVDKYQTPLEQSGLAQYAYIPPKIPMYRHDWPTLSEMILSGKRAVVFMDYMANQTQVPYILDEFSQMWETPFSPTNAAFPCTVQRPPGISGTQINERLYLINHNLNVELNFGGQHILIPNFAQLAETNALNGSGSLGAMATECAASWGHPPNFLLVDFYNVGNGSVFEVAARMNNVTYNNQKCCGADTSLSRAAGPVTAARSTGFAALCVALLTAFVLF